MGAFRRSVCFDSSDEAAALSLPASVQTKNTFVHFAKRDPTARRQTCAGRLVTVKEPVRSAAVRSSARAVTCHPQAHVAATVQIPDLSTLRRLSAVSEASSCLSPTSPLCLCLETPTTLFLPSPRNSQAAEPQVAQCFATTGFTTPLYQGAVTPVSCATPVSFASFDHSPMATPRMHVQWPSMPMQLSPQPSPHVSPLSTPRTVSPEQFCQMYQVPEVWQPVQEEPRKRSRRNKAALPAKPNEMTLMLRHLPLDLTPDELLAKLAHFIPHIDFYYLPTNFETKNNLGYAFLNFTDAAAASEFTAFWKASGIPEAGEVPIQEARVQGFAENVEKFRNSSVMPMLTVELKPRIFDRGVQKPFPAPDKAVPAVGSRFKPTVQ